MSSSFLGDVIVVVTSTRRDDIVISTSEDDIVTCVSGDDIVTSMSGDEVSAAPSEKMSSCHCYFCCHKLGINMFSDVMDRDFVLFYSPIY